MDCFITSILLTRDPLNCSYTLTNGLFHYFHSAHTGSIELQLRIDKWTVSLLLLAHLLHCMKLSKTLLNRIHSGNNSTFQLEKRKRIIPGRCKHLKKKPHGPNIRPLFSEKMVPQNTFFSDKQSENFPFSMINERELQSFLVKSCFISSI